MNIELHPLCTLFPRMAGAEFDALVSDIKCNGLREPITLLDGMILDGGNRYAACVAAGVEPIFREFQGGDPISYVLSVNFHRRHLSAGQQAAVVAVAQDWSKASAHGGDRSKVQGLHLETAAGRAQAANASLRTQRMADKVAQADPKLAKKVAHGDVSLPAAVEQITGKRPGKKPHVEVPEDDGPSAEEIAEAEAAAADDAERVRLILESDSALAAMTEKCKQQAAQIRILEERVRGLTNEAAQAIRLAKSWRTKFERMEKAAA